MNNVAFYTQYLEFAFVHKEIIYIGKQTNEVIFIIDKKKERKKA